MVRTTLIARDLELSVVYFSQDYFNLVRMPFNLKEIQTDDFHSP